MVTLGNYNPYQDLDSWYGVPDYGGAYNSYMGVQQQQLPLSRLISMVQEIQNGMNRRPLGNGAVSVSTPTMGQVPAQIANSLMSQQQRLLSMPRQQWSQSGYQPDPNGITPPPATGPGGGSASPGGLSPTQVNYGGGGFAKTGAGSGNVTPLTIKKTPTYEPPKVAPKYNPNTGANAGGIAGSWRKF